MQCPGTIVRIFTETPTAFGKCAWRHEGEGYPIPIYGSWGIPIDVVSVHLHEQNPDGVMPPERPVLATGGVVDGPVVMVGQSGIETFTPVSEGFVTDDARVSGVKIKRQRKA